MIHFLPYIFSVTPRTQAESVTDHPRFHELELHTVDLQPPVPAAQIIKSSHVGLSERGYRVVRNPMSRGYEIHGAKGNIPVPSCDIGSLGEI